MALSATTGLKPEVIDQIQGVFSRFPEVASVTLYGSRAKGTYRNGSDIDLCVRLSRKAPSGSDWYAPLAEALDDLDLIYTIDLSFYDDIENPQLIDHVNRVGVPLYP